MERCEATSRIYEGIILNLRVDKVRLADGRTTSREVLEHRGAVAIAPILDRNQIILIRQYRYAVGEALLEVPAGTLEEHERPEDCAVRELEEETGYRCRELNKILECYMAPGYCNEKIHVYLAQGLTKSIMKPAVDESIQIQQLSFEAALQKIVSGEIKDAKTICALLRTAQLLKEKE